MPKGIKGFQRGHQHSKETKRKIGLANRGIWIKFNCDYCGKENEEKESHYKRKKRHFCSMNCYSRFQSEKLPREEHNRFGTGFSPGERRKRIKARSDANHAIRDGKLDRLPCSICGGISEMHHPDYNDPLRVIWLCKKHHRRIYENPELLEGL